MESWYRKGMWATETPEADERAALHGEFDVQGGKIALRIYAPCPFRATIGDWSGEGPARFSPDHPEYSEWTLDLPPGKATVEIDAHYEGVETRLMPSVPPFVAAAVFVGDEEIPVRWQAGVVEGLWRRVRRVNPQLGWIEWTRSPREVRFAEPRPANVLPHPPTAASVTVPVRPALSVEKIAEGRLRERFGYGNDDPPTGFYLRDLFPKGVPDGVWRRFDLGRVRLGRLGITLDIPPGAVIEIASAESLTDGRVSPWLTLSTGLSANLDRFVARGGPETFRPFSPRGGRFVEVHVLAPPSQIHWENVGFRDRSYHGEPQGSFRCSDPRLERIWSVGVETYRACAEDALIDNPSRERGQWMGDALTIALEAAGVAYSDLSLVRRALVQAAQGARADGLVIGLGPGTPIHMPTYALHWTVACLRYLRLTGDRLAELWPAAERNAEPFLHHLTEKGLVGVPGWSFVDWGASSGDGPALDLFAHEAMRAMADWARLLKQDPAPYDAAATTLAGVARTGFHAEALALRAGFPADREIVKRQYRKAFPNDPQAPPLANPSSDGSKVVTPFFAHWALDGLWRSGEGDFALDQYRSLWGWALDQGLTTWPEVFDLRWSHCHAWSGCPTWQLTRHVLGLEPRRDLGADVYDANPKPCGLKWAEGVLPDGTQVRREGGKIVVSSDGPIRLRHPDGSLTAPRRRHEIEVV